MPKVSVLMPVYNGQKYLREAVESILSQTFTDFEFIIVDDCSTDETPAILKDFQDPRIVPIRNERNIQLVRSLNKGLEIAQGKYIARQDADDRSASGRLKKQVAFLDSHPETGVTGSWFVIMDVNGREVRVIQLPTENNMLQDELLFRNCFCHGSVIFRRNCLGGPFSYREDLPLAEDWDLWLRIGERNHLANIAEPLYSWRLLPNSLSQANKVAERRVARRILEETIQRRSGGGKWIKPSNRAQARYHLYLACDDLAEGKDYSAQEHLQQAFILDTELAQDVDYVLDFVVYRAIDLCPASSHGVSGHHIEPGTSYIRKFIKLLPLTDGVVYRVSKALGRFHIVLAHANYQTNCFYQVRRHCLAGLIYDPCWLKNRGVSSILLESIIGSKVMGKIRATTRRLQVTHTRSDKCPM